MLAVDTILALRDQIAACRTIIEVSDREIETIRSQVEKLRDMLPEETTDV
jgi:acetolactate synthase regulatory subunit